MEKRTTSEKTIENNNIYNGNAYELIKNMKDNSVDCIYTDIPYLYQKGGASFTLLGQRMVKMRSVLKDISNGIDFRILDEFVRVMKKINIFIWCSKAQLYEVMTYFLKFNVNYEILTWNKTNPVPKNNSWNSDIEYCLTFREKNYTLNPGYHLKSKWYQSALNKHDKDLYEHPTIKPLGFVKQHIEHTTQPNDVILDPFLGSGTTAVAAKELGRHYIGFEIDERYYKIAKNRINGITATGQTSIFTNFE